MGVCNLWSVLEPVKETINLNDIKGQIVAIDLSGWIVQSCQASQHTAVNGTYVMMRTLLYRIVNILKSGIRPVFVLDGTAPDIKSQTLKKRQQQQGHSGNRPTTTERIKFKTCSTKCIELLEGLGLPYISYDGEAEKLCALLNNCKKVDACMTDDSDCLLYGGKVIYRNYDQTKKQDTTVERYRLDDIINTLKLNRRDLIVCALMAGCDYNEGGVYGVGQKKTYSLIQELKLYYSDVLDRILSWRDDEKLQQWKEINEKLTQTAKSRHCKTCNHQGSCDVHVNKGCPVCDTSTSCQSSSSVPCPCSWHILHNQISPHSKEMEFSSKALKDSNFPDKKIIEEFTNDVMRECDKSYDFQWTIPNFKKLLFVTERYLKWTKLDVDKCIVPAIVYMTLFDILPISSVNLIKIKRACQNNHLSCYEVSFKISNDQTENTGYTFEEIDVKVEMELLKSKYPTIVEEFEREIELKKSSTKKGKRKKDKDEHQRTFTDFFTAKKRLNFEDKK